MANQHKIKQTETEIYRYEGRRWPALILLLLAALVIASAVTLAGRWIYREISGSEDKAPTSTSDTSDFDANKSSETAPPEMTEPANSGNNNPESSNESGSQNSDQAPQTTPTTGDEDLPSTGG